MSSEQQFVGSGDFNGTTVQCRYQNGDELKTRQEELKQNLKKLQEWNMAKEQVEIKVTKSQNAISQLQSQRPQNGIHHQLQQQISQISDQMEQLKQNLLCINNNLSCLSQRILNDLVEYTKLCENLIIKWTKVELHSWKHQQKIAQIGGPDPLPSLATLTQRYQTMTDYVFTGWNYIQRNATTLAKMVNAQQVQQVRVKLFSLFYQLLNTSFLVVQQPPIIAKNRITVRVGLLGAIDKFGFESRRTMAQCRVVSEDFAAELKRNPEKINGPIQTVGKLDDERTKEKDIEELTKEKALGFEFKNIKVKVDSRKTSAKDGEAIKKKYYLLFSCTINIDDQSFKIFALSLPFMVSVHGSQDKDLWAKAFWDMAYSDGLGDTIPMNVRSEVPWSDLATGLQHIFSCIMNANTEKKFDPKLPPERKLTDTDLAYIKLRMFNGQLPAQPNPTISWAKLVTEPLCHMSSRERKLDFSLWEWFFRIADMLQEKAGHEIRAKALWNLNLLEGFISKSEADVKLSSCKKPTLLLRFSDNNLSSVSAVVLKADRFVDHLAPFKNKDDITDRMSLPTLIIRCEELENIGFVYPNKPKKLIEDQIPVPKQPSTTTTSKDGYTTCTIKTVHEGEIPRNRSISTPNTPDGNYNATSPVTADIYAPGHTRPHPPPPHFYGSKFQNVPIQSTPNPNYNNNEFNDNNYSHGAATVTSPRFDEQNFVVNNNNNFNQEVLMMDNKPFNDMDANMLDPDFIELIFQSIENHETYFENNQLNLDSDDFLMLDNDHSC